MTLCLAACGGDEAGDPPALPTEASPAAILDFLDTRRFDGPGWRPESPAPRPELTPVSPHDRVRVYQNEALIQSRPSGDYAPDSMAVKEMYDGDTPVGYAVLWLEPGAARFTWLCYGPTGRCGLAEQAAERTSPIFGQGAEVVCGQCHGGMVFTEIAP